ncbi:MAG TPA: TetR/AcrR family transcriptional regulator, partial [Mycobacterium sp.]|nr:TetR/AcrR family transcriptional regulator [Mycobacterium sp.]
MPTTSPARAGRGRRSARPSGDDREAAILATAEQLLEERNFGDISVDDLARGAGLS